MKKRILLPIAIFLIAAMLCGCSNVQIEDVPEIRAGTDAFLSAILADDADAAYDQLHNEIGRSEFEAVYTEFQKCLTGVDAYEMTPISYNFAVRNGVKTVQLSYRMTAGSGTFIVSAAIIEGEEGLVGFNIAPEEATTLIYSGTPGHMQGANALQWIVLIIGILTWAIVSWMLVDCCKRKPKRKVLWLLFILLGAIVLHFSSSDGAVNFRFNIGLHLRLSTLLRYGDGSVNLSLVFPLGAVVYFINRKKLTPQVEAVEEESNAANSELSAEKESETDRIDSEEAGTVEDVAASNQEE